MSPVCRTDHARFAAVQCDVQRVVANHPDRRHTHADSAAAVVGVGEAQIRLGLIADDLRIGQFCQQPNLPATHKLRGDWEAVKDSVMYEICKAKFSQNPDLADQLVATKDAELIEGNTWGDRIWGVCDGVGENRLGKILMRIRAEM